MPAGSRPGTADDARRLAAVLLRMSQGIRRVAATGAAELGLTPAQAQALLFVHRTKSFLASLGLLARYLGVTHATAVGVVDGLERRGLLVRRPDPRDRRVTLLALTAEGRQAAARLERWLEELEVHLQALDARQREALERGLAAVVASLQRAGLVVVGEPCRGCVHFREGVRPGSPEPHYCALVERYLDDEEAARECPDHQPAAAR